MIDYVGMLKEFHERYGHTIGFNSYNITTKDRELRRKLIKEEWKELKDAIDMHDIVEIADGLADLLYVVFGTAVTYGIPIDAIFTEVHRSNMTKSLEKNKFGKTIKGPDFQPPRIHEILGIRRVE